MRRVIYSIIPRIGILLSAFIIAFTPLAAAQNGQGQGNNKLPNGKPFQYLQTQIDSIDVAVEQLIGRVNSLEEFRLAAEDAIARLESENADLQAQLDALSKDVSQLQDQVNENTGEIDTLKSQIESHTASIAALQSATASLQAQITANDGDIASLQSQVNANFSKIFTLQGDINAANARINSLGLVINSLQLQIDYNEHNIANLTTSIANNAALIAAVTTRIDQVELALTQKQERVSGTCGPGFSIREIRQDGSVVCEQDDVGAGTPGLDIVVVQQTLNIPDGTALDPIVSARVTLNCPPGYFVTNGYYEMQEYTLSLSHDITSSRPGGPPSNGSFVQAPDLAIQSWYFGGYNNSVFYDANYELFAVCVKVQ